MQHRLEKSARRRPSPAALLVDVKIADALVVAGVEILDGRDAVLVRCRAERVENFPASDAGYSTRHSPPAAWCSLFKK